MSAPTAITIPLQNYSTGLANYDAMIVTNSAGGVTLESSSKSGGSALGAKDISFNQGYVMNTNPFTTPSSDDGAGVSYSGWFWPATIQGGDMLVYVTVNTTSGPRVVATPVLQINLKTTGAPTGKAWVSANYRGTTITTSDPSSAAVPRTWNFFCFTVECSGSVAAMSLHTNGKVYAATGTAPAYVEETWTANYLAAAGSSGSNQFVGKMADMRSFNRVMRPMEISVLYAFYRQNMKGGTPLAASLNVLALNTSYNANGTMAANTLTLDPQSVFSYIAVQRTPPFAQGAATQYVSAAQVQHVSGEWVWTDASYNSFAPALYSLVPYAMGVQAAKGVMCATAPYIYAVTYTFTGNVATFNVVGSYHTLNAYNGGNLVASRVALYADTSMNTDTSYAYTFVPVNVLGQLGQACPTVYVPYLKNVTALSVSASIATFTLTGYYQTVSISCGTTPIATLSQPNTSFTDTSVYTDPPYVYTFVPYNSQGQPGNTYFAYLPSISSVTAVPGIGTIKFTIVGNYSSFVVRRGTDVSFSGSGTTYSDNSPLGVTANYRFTPVAPDGSTGTPYLISSGATSSYTMFMKGMYGSVPYYSYDGLYWFPPNDPSSNLTLLGATSLRNSMCTADYGSNLVNGGPGWVCIPYNESGNTAFYNNTIYTSADNRNWYSGVYPNRLSRIGWTTNRFTATDGQRLVILDPGMIGGNGAGPTAIANDIVRAHYYDNGNFDVSQCCTLTSTGSFYPHSIAYANGRWVAVGNGSTGSVASIAYSTNGASWTLATINGSGVTIPNLAYVKYFGLLINSNLYDSTKGTTGVNGPVWIAGGMYSSSVLLNMLYSCDNGVSWYILTPSASSFIGFNPAFTGAYIFEIEGDSTGKNFIMTTNWQNGNSSNLYMFNTTNGFQTINQNGIGPTPFYSVAGTYGLCYAGLQYADANMVNIVNARYPVGNAKSIVLNQPVQVFISVINNMVFTIDTGVTWFSVPSSSIQTLSSWPTSSKIIFSTSTTDWRLCTYKYQLVYGSTLDASATLDTVSALTTSTSVIFSFKGLFSGVSLVRTNNTNVSDPSLTILANTLSGNPSTYMTYTDNNVTKYTSYTYVCTPIFGSKPGISQTVTIQTPWDDLHNMGPDANYGWGTNGGFGVYSSMTGALPSITYDPIENTIWVGGGFNVGKNILLYYNNNRWTNVDLPYNKSIYVSGTSSGGVTSLSRINGYIVVTMWGVTSAYNLTSYTCPNNIPLPGISAANIYYWLDGSLNGFITNNGTGVYNLIYDGRIYWSNYGDYKYLQAAKNTSYLYLNNNFPYASTMTNSVVGGNNWTVNPSCICFNGKAGIIYYMSTASYWFKVSDPTGTRATIANYPASSLTMCYDYYSNTTFVGGSFTTVGSIHAKGVAMSTVNSSNVPQAWQPLGSGIGLYTNNITGTDFNLVNAVTVDPNRGIVYAGGQFTLVSNNNGAITTNVNNIAQYNLSTGIWSGVANGVTGGIVKTMYFDSLNNNLYVLGTFTQDGLGNRMDNMAVVNVAGAIPNITVTVGKSSNNAYTVDVVADTVLSGGTYGNTIYNVYSFQPQYLVPGTSATYTVTYTCTSPRTIYIFAVGGGGGGGTCVGGGGGGGQVVMSSVTLPSTGSGGNTIAVTVGGGGAGGQGPITTTITSYNASYGGGQGLASSVTFNDPTLSSSSITAAGGGGGGANANGNGGAGSSGGGAAGFPLNLAASAGAGTSGQGYNGGAAAAGTGSASFRDSTLYATGGGGGGAGSAASGPTGGNGIQINATTSPIIADFHPNSIPYSTYYWGGGGGGGGAVRSTLTNNSLTGGKGGGGGGASANSSGFTMTGDTNTSLTNGGNGTSNTAVASGTTASSYSCLGGNGGPNTGGGGGGSYNGIPGNGGSGIVILAFPQT